MAESKEAAVIEPSTTGPTVQMRDIIGEARKATEKEHSMTLLQGIKLYPKAIAWSVLISTCIVMEGYDISASSLLIL
jgi:MFS transporter, SP family, general alpha glucoside:H+ symporter